MRIAVVFGGKSPEHLVAFKSGLFILTFLDKERFLPQGVYIKRDGSFATPKELQEAIREYFRNLTIAIYKPEDGVPENICEILQKYALYGPGSDPDRSDFLDNLASRRYDLAYPVFHGKNGEDGTFQGLFEVFDLPYVGCDVTGSVIGVDKILTKKLCQAAGIPVVDYVDFKTFQWQESRQEILARIERELLPYPLFIKPPTLGSSIGIYRADDRESLISGIEKSLRFEGRVLVEKGVYAPEIAVSVMGNDRLAVSIPGQFNLNPDFFDYEAKYGAESLLDFVPAPLSPELLARAKENAERVYRALELSVTARVDCFLVGDQFLVNEVTPIPGLSSEAIYTMQWEYEGLSKREIFSRLVDLSLERHKTKKLSGIEMGL